MLFLIFLLLIIAIAGLVWGIKALRVPSRSKRAAAVSSPSRYNIYEFDIAGEYYYLNQIMTLAIPNSDYDLTKYELLEYNLTDVIYRYEFPEYPAGIVPEPDNPKSPDALKVMVRDMCVGYIRGIDNKKCRNVLSGALGTLVSCSIRVKGGEYKKLYNKADWNDNPDYMLITDKEDIQAFVRITVEPADPSQVANHVLTIVDIKL